MSDPLRKRLWRRLPRRWIGWLRRRGLSPDWDSPYACSVYDVRKTCPQSCWKQDDQPTCLRDYLITADALEHDISSWVEREVSLGGVPVPDFWDEHQTSERLAMFLTMKGWVKK